MELTVIAVAKTLLAALAVYRLARLIALEEGPFGVFTAVRGALDSDQRTWVGRGINCPFCIGFWLAWGAALWIAPIGVEWAIVSLAVAGLQTWLQSNEGEA